MYGFEWNIRMKTLCFINDVENFVWQSFSYELYKQAKVFRESFSPYLHCREQEEGQALEAS